MASNYFPTKEHLFAALSKDYDGRFADVLSSFHAGSPLSLDPLAKLFSAIMDLQHEYRSTIICVCSTYLEAAGYAPADFRELLH